MKREVDDKAAALQNYNMITILMIIALFCLCILLIAAVWQVSVVIRWMF